MNKITYLILAFFCAFTFQNCQNDDDFKSDNSIPISSEVKDDIFKAEHFGQASKGNFFGKVINREGNSLSEVQITIGNKITTTDHNGVFILNNADVFENFAFVKAEKTGYTKGSRVVIPKIDGVNTIEIVLLENNVIATVNSGEPSHVSLDNGANVSFSGDFVNSSGASYSGQVEVVMHYIAPNETETFAEMPGSLFAQNIDNNARILETYGMLSVNLYSPTGEQLNIDKDNPATIEFPVDDSQIGIAPDTINLWYFDETQGYWKEEGQAVKEGNKYIAEVNHFTWWNCDLPSELVEFCFSVSPMTAGPPPPFTNYHVEIIRNSNDQYIYSGDVSANQTFSPECGFIPKDEEITIFIYSTSGSCDGKLVHQEILGPYSNDTTENISFSENITTTTITGSVTNCTGNPITNGYLFLDGENMFSITDGTINFGVQHCSTITKDVLVYDLDTDNHSNPTTITLDGTAVDLGSFNTCNTTGGIYNGDVQLSTQEEVDYFVLFGYTEIDGNFTIGDAATSSDITNLSGLSTLTTITGIVFISQNKILPSLQGLENITTVNDKLIISFNDMLVNVDELSGISNIGGDLEFYKNKNLLSIDLPGISTLGVFYVGSHLNLTTIKLNNLVNTGALNFYFNSSMTSLGEYNSLTTIDGDVRLIYNNSLIALNSLINITNIGNDFIIKGNNALTSLQGLNNITTITNNAFIEGNDVLTSLNGLENLTSVYGIGIGISEQSRPGANPNLTDLCALQNLFTNGTYNSAIIENNGYNPSVQDIIDGNCSI